MTMTTTYLAQVIANEIAAQGNETDNLGDNESLCLIGILPTINLVQLSEVILHEMNSNYEPSAQDRDLG